MEILKDKSFNQIKKIAIIASIVFSLSSCLSHDETSKNNNIQNENIEYHIPNETNNFPLKYLDENIDPDSAITREEIVP